MTKPGAGGESELLRAFRRNQGANADAFNRHDFEAAFAALPDDVEWVTVQEVFDDGAVLRGREEVIAYFHGLLESWPDWRTEIQGIGEPAAGVVLVELEVHGTGPRSGIPVSHRVFQIWDFRAQPLRISEHLSREAALAAGGATSSG